MTLHLTASRRPPAHIVERRLPARVPRRRIRAPPQQHRHHFHVAAPRRHVQRPVSDPATVPPGGPTVPVPGTLCCRGGGQWALRTGASGRQPGGAGGSGRRQLGGQDGHVHVHPSLPSASQRVLVRFRLPMFSIRTSSQTETGKARRFLHCSVSTAAGQPTGFSQGSALARVRFGSRFRVRLPRASFSQRVTAQSSRPASIYGCRDLVSAAGR